MSIEDEGLPHVKGLSELLTGPHQEETIAAVRTIDEIRESTPMKGSLSSPAFVSELFGQRVEIPIDWLRLPDRTLEYIHLRLPPGHGFGTHLHAYGEEVYFITGGTGRVRIRADEYSAAPGDIFHLPRNTWHSIWNPPTSSSELSFLLVNAPPIRLELRSRYWNFFQDDDQMGWSADTSVSDK